MVTILSEFSCNPLLHLLMLYSLATFSVLWIIASFCLIIHCEKLLNNVSSCTQENKASDFLNPFFQVLCMIFFL